MSHAFSRRRALKMAGAWAVASTADRFAAAQPQLADADPLIAGFTGGADIIDDKVKIEVPEKADVGTAIPLTVQVDSPMTSASHVSALLVYIVGNDNPKVGRFKFPLPGGIAQVTTRIRLERMPTKSDPTQKLVAIASVEEGRTIRFFRGSKVIAVTVAACRC